MSQALARWSDQVAVERIGGVPFRMYVERPRRLEWALLVGTLLVATGLGLSLYALVTWNDAGFGQLDYPDTLRIVIPGTTLIACGMQTVLSALFLSVLGLRRR